MTLRKCVSFFARLAFVSCCVYYVFTAVNIDDISLNPDDILWAKLLPTLPLSLLIVLSYSLRFKYILGVNIITVSESWSGITLNNFYNIILPLRGGDFIRAAIVRSKLDSYFSSLAVIYLEKLIDIKSLVIIVLISQLLSLNYLIFGFVIILFGTCVYNYAMNFLFSFIKERNLKLNSSSWPFYNFFKHLRPNWCLKTCLIVGILTCCSRVLEALLAYQIAKSLGLNVPLDVFLVVNAVVSLGLMIPGAPAFIGTFHAATVFAFSLFGWDKNEALMIAIANHFYLLLIVMALGAFTTVFGKKQ